MQQKYSLYQLQINELYNKLQTIVNEYQHSAFLMIMGDYLHIYPSSAQVPVLKVELGRLLAATL